MEVNKLRVIYLGAKEHRFKESMFFDFTYNDIIDYPGIDFCCDMLDVDLQSFDIIIATPPCNYYSRANRWYNTSKVSQSTKHLLPNIIDACIKAGKPFIVENTFSWRVPLDKGCLMFNYGSHVFYTNVLMPIGYLRKYQPMYIKTKLSYGHRDNNPNVHYILELFLSCLQPCQ